MKDVTNNNTNKMIGIESFRKNILGWLGDRITAPSLLVRALYRCDHQAIQAEIFFRKDSMPITRFIIT